MLPDNFQSLLTDSTSVRQNTASELTHAGPTEPGSRGSTVPDARRAQNWPTQNRHDISNSQTLLSETVRTSSETLGSLQLVPHFRQAQSASSVIDDTVTSHILQTTVGTYNRSPARVQQAVIYANLLAQYAHTSTSKEANSLTTQADSVQTELRKNAH